MTDKEFEQLKQECEKLKQKIEEEEARRNTLVSLKEELAVFDAQMEELRKYNLLECPTCLEFKTRLGYITFSLKDCNLVKSFLDNYRDFLQLKIKQQEKILK